MIAEIITIGTEITMGSTLNTNSQYIANKLLDLGIETYYHSSVDDNKHRLIDIFQTALNRADLIITTGGLGPTADDITKEVIAEALGLKIIKDKDMEDTIRNRFKSLNREMPISNLKQSTKLESSYFLNNLFGTAPGIFINLEHKKIIMLPGPPREMVPMFNNEAMQYLSKEGNIVTRSINTIGIGESDLESQLKEIINNYPNLSISTFAKESEVEIKIIGLGNDLNSIEENIDDAVKVINQRFNKFIYGFNNISIEDHVYELLKSMNFKIGFCESCTGGLISSRFAGIEGVSQVFDRSIVTYSNKSKIDEVGVSPNTLDEFGAVSEETAFEMAKGLLDKANLDISLSVTGIAGPEGGTLEKPVGLVYLCIYTKNNNRIIKLNLRGNRISIQNKVATKAFFELRKFILENY